MFRNIIGNLIFMAFTPMFLSAMTYQVKDVLKMNTYNPLIKINNNGIVAGYTLDGPHQSTTFFYDSQIDEFIFITAFESECTRLYDLNNKNEIIGYYYDEVFSPLYGKTTQLVPFSWSKQKGCISLKSTLGHTCGSYDSVRINDLGWIAGYGFVDSIADFYSKKGEFRVFYSSLILPNDQKSIVLNHSSAPYNFGVTIKSLNNKGDAAGGMFYSSGQHSEIWQPAYAILWDSVQKKILPLGNLVGQDKFYSCATDMNDSKQIVGISEVNIKRNGKYYYHAFLWENGTMLDLGTIDQNQNSIARSINSRGDVVGRSGSLNWSDSGNRAFIWSRLDGIRDLNVLINTTSFDCKLHEAYDVNDNGQIVCLATMNGEWHIVMLTPEN